MRSSRVCLLTVVLSLAAGLAFGAKPRNVILFIGDGMSTPQRMTANEFSRKLGRGDLAINGLPHQATTRTCSASSLVTDSAAAATAIACGTKTQNGALGVDPQGEPVWSCAVEAKKAGKRVGIVTTVTINHATPSGFYAHRKSRGDGYGIGLDLLASGFDYFAGGGLSRHDDKKHAEYRGDIYKLAPESGYTFILKDRARFDALKPGCGKVWYVASGDAMPFSIDADKWEGVPTLAELTRKGLELLAPAEKGFFMMVEAGKIDYAGHANDAATNLREVLALDEAVKVALGFQEKNPDTLIVVTGDHETGGMTMGFAGTGYAFYMDRLTNQTCSVERLAREIGAAKPGSFEEIKPMLEKAFGFVFGRKDAVDKNPMAITPEELAEMEKAFSHDLELTRAGKKENQKYDAVKLKKLPSVLKSVFSHKCGIGWTSGAHTALPVLTTAQGVGAERFGGFIDNTDIAKTLKDLVRGD